MLTLFCCLIAIWKSVSGRKGEGSSPRERKLVNEKHVLRMPGHRSNAQTDEQKYGSGYFVSCLQRTEHDHAVGGDRGGGKADPRFLLASLWCFDDRSLADGGPRPAN